MQVLLLEKIARLGDMGEEVNVKPGFARNFLLPQKKAMPATVENRAVFEAKKAEYEAQMAERQKEAEALAEKVQKVQKVVLGRPASETGQLYGSVKARDIADFLAAEGVDVPRSTIMIGEPMKTVGDFTVKIALHPQVTIDLQVTVERQSS